MHILLTDVLTCPRCGPAFGLIVLADRVEDRLVVDGRLGCANCREEYEIRGGVADLRIVGGADPDPEEGDPVGGEDRAFRTAALLGVGHGLGTVVAAGATSELVDAVQALLPNAQVVGVGTASSDGAGAGWLVLSGGLPFRDRSLRGVALLGGSGEAVIREASRALAPGARLVLDPAPPRVADLLDESGLTVLLDQDGVVVASTPTPG